MALAPGVLAMTGFFSVNAFEALAWVLFTWVFVRLVRTGEVRLWVPLGLLAGLGFESKHTMITLLAAVGAGVLATRARTLVWNRWFVAGAALALVLAVPNVVWQAAHGFPSLEFYRNAAMFKNLPSPPLATIVEQLRFMPVYRSRVAGGRRLVPVHPRGRTLARARHRLRGVAGTSDRLATEPPGSPPRHLPGADRGRHFGDRVVDSAPCRTRGDHDDPAGGVRAGGADCHWRAPPEMLAPCVARLGIQTSGERGKTSPIPQLLADRTGWESFVAQIAGIYAALPPEDRQRALIYAPSYGQAGAIDLLGRAYGLPRAIAGQNSYWHWSAREGVDADVVIAIDADPQDLRALFREVQLGLIFETLREPEVCDSWLAAFVDQDVRGFNVPVQDAVATPMPPRPISSSSTWSPNVPWRAMAGSAT